MCEMESEETDKQFVVRMSEDVLSIPVDDLDRLIVLALRGAETQWRPIEEGKDKDAKSN